MFEKYHGTGSASSAFRSHGAAWSPRLRAQAHAPGAGCQASIASRLFRPTFKLNRSGLTLPRSPFKHTPKATCKYPKFRAVGPLTIMHLAWKRELTPFQPHRADDLDGHKMTLMAFSPGSTPPRAVLLAPC